jgi:hypothetical protein
MLTNFASVRNTSDADIGVHNVVSEFRKYNPFFAKISHFTGMEILKNCNIIVLKNQNLYTEHEYNPNTYIIAYGAVYLKSKGLGLFKQCLLGESLGEESILDHNHNKYTILFKGLIL